MIPNYNGARWLPGCLDALAAQTFQDHEVLLVDNGSTDLPRADYVQLVTRNRLRLFAKSVPLSLLLKHLPRMAYGQLYFAIAFSRPSAGLAGYAWFRPRIPHVWGSGDARGHRVGSRPPELDQMLTARMREPPLRVLLRHRSGRLWS